MSKKDLERIFDALAVLSGEATRKVEERPYRAAFSHREWVYARFLYEWAEALRNDDKLMLYSTENCLEAIEDEAPEACRQWRQRVDALAQWTRQPK